MIIHIFSRETVYSHKYLYFLNDYFDIEHHRFIFRSKKTFKKFEYPNNVRAKISFYDNWFKFLFQLYPLLRRSNKIIIHYLATGPSLFFWFLFNGLLSKAIWNQWGNDLYFFRKKKNFKDKVFEYVRRHIIRKMGAIGCIPKEDYDITREVYKTNAVYFFTFYPNPIGYDKLNVTFTDLKSKPDINVFLGNSAHPSNDHLELLEALKKIDSQRLNIYCPLAYGPDQGYIDHVINTGKAYFGSRFYYFLKRQPPDEYLNFLSGMDVAIMNHKRKQGWGTINILLFLGKKVYIREESTSYSFLKKSGVAVYSTNWLLEGREEGFMEFAKELQEQNNQIIKEEFSLDRCAELWQQVFDWDVTKFKDPNSRQ